MRMSMAREFSGSSASPIASEIAARVSSRLARFRNTSSTSNSLLARSSMPSGPVTVRASKSAW